jgi:xylose isomerase
MLAGQMSLEKTENMALQDEIDLQPLSGRQEQIENLLDRAILSDAM